MGAYVDMTPYARRLPALIDELGARAVGPTHGLPPRDLDAVMPRVIDGLMTAGGAGERYQAR